MAPKAPNAPVTCNWVKSVVTESTLSEFVKSGYLPNKDIMSYRAPDPSEEKPHPKEGEVIIFTDHMSRGFAPPGSKFFRDVLQFFDLKPQDIGPNSVSNICNFQVFYEVYLGEEPSLLLFRELFYLNRQNEHANGPSLELRGISIQWRRDYLFPYAELPSHPKDWNKTWFYCQDTSPAGENPLPGFRALRLESNHPLPDKLTVVEHLPLTPTIKKIKALLGNGLDGIDLVRVWVAWRVIPLSRRPGLMCTYSGEKDDPLRHSPDNLPDDAVEATTQTLLKEGTVTSNAFVLLPFCKKNPAPAANDNFWKVKYDHEAAKQARAAKRAKRKATKTGTSRKRKPSASDMLRLEDSDDDEEEEGTGNSQAVEEELHESQRQTRTSKDAELSSGLPDVTRKRRNEDTSPSSGESMQSNMPAFKTAPGVQVKPRKKAKKNKPAQDPVVTEPALGAAAPDASAREPPPQPSHDVPVTSSDPPAEQAINDSDNPEAPSPSKADDPEVEILKTQFVEPAQPTVLAKCSAKEELLERRKAKLDVADYTHWSIGEIVSGYINQVHSSCDLEIDMVKQIQQKSEATISQIESEIADLKGRLAAQELEIQKSNSKFEFSVSEQEKLKRNFEAEKKTWADEKASLVTRVETAEALLAEATAELSGLKR
ncbi:hypothetical protein VPH35_005452 [Triticum aestivum]